MTTDPASNRTTPSKQSSDKAAGGGSLSRGDGKVTKEPPWWILAAFLGAEPVLLALYGFSVGSRPIVLIEILVGAASLLFGGLIGFLFGLPRVSTVSGSPRSANGDTSGSGADNIGVLTYAPSNNLEQVVDWLTKILLGAGLVEIGKLGNALADIGNTVSSALPVPVTGSGVVTQVTVVASVILGFLGTFLWTRFHYPSMQIRADLDVLAQLKSDVRNVVKAVEDVASGKLVVQGKSSEAPTTKKALRAEPVDSAWPDELQQKVAQLLEAEPSYDTDPAATIFEGTPRVMNGRRLEAEVSSRLRDGIIVNLRVRGTRSEQLTGKVTFLLHPTYPEIVLESEASRNVASETVYSDGAYTVVAVADGGRTVLAYDLSELPGAPQWFIDS